MSAEPPLADPASPAGGKTPAAKMALVVLDQRFDAGTLYLLRAAVLAHAAATGMPEQCARDVVLAVHELAANVIQHGTGAGRLVMRISPGTLRCTVEDAGTPAWDGPRAAAPDGLTQSGSDRAAGPWPYLPGHGLWLVREVADQMTVADLPVGSQVTVTFLLPDVEDASRAEPWPGVRRAGRQGSAAALTPGPRRRRCRA